MEKYTLFQPKNILSVSQLTHYLRQLIESDEILQELWVQGELSNVSRPSSGHLYFTLKDAEAAVRCVMWRNAVARLDFDPSEGVAVEAHGSMGVYEVSGQVQLYVDTMQPAGEGALYQKFVRLKAKLEAEGLFDIETKRTLPPLPKTIGIVTSPTGAALQDMLNTLQRRYPIAEVVLSPTAVQGVDAPPAIIAALERLNREIHPDLILIGRGGGSIEDLWAFNDEAVTRAVAASEAPIISGVGHETDFTLTDFAADLRAPTPTAAAEIATPDRAELLSCVLEIASHQSTLLRERLTNLRWEGGMLINRLQQLSPHHAIRTYQQSLDEMTLRLNRAIRISLDSQRLRLANLERSLKSLNPQAVLNRGYAVVTRKKDGELVKIANQVSVDEDIHVQISLGSLDARVTKIHKEN